MQLELEQLDLSLQEGCDLCNVASDEPKHAVGGRGAWRERSVDADLDALPTAERAVVVGVLAEFADIATAVMHGDPMASNIRIDDDGRVGLLDWDESRVDVVWHDLSNLGIQVLPDADHERAQRLSNAWEAVNGWVVEPAYARRRLALLT